MNKLMPKSYIFEALFKEPYIKGYHISDALLPILASKGSQNLLALLAYFCQLRCFIALCHDALAYLNVDTLRLIKYLLKLLMNLQC